MCNAELANIHVGQGLSAEASGATRCHANREHDTSTTLLSKPMRLSTVEYRTEGTADHRQVSSRSGT